MGGRSEGNENRWGFMLQIMVWDLKQVLKDTAEAFFFSHTTNQNLQAKCSKERCSSKRHGAVLGSVPGSAVSHL